MNKSQKIMPLKSSIKSPKYEKTSRIVNVTRVQSKVMNSKPNLEQFRKYKQVSCLIQMKQICNSSFQFKIQLEIQKILRETNTQSRYEGFQRLKSSRVQSQSQKANYGIRSQDSTISSQIFQQSPLASKAFSQMKQKFDFLSKNSEALKKQSIQSAQTLKQQQAKVKQLTNSLIQLNSNIQKYKRQAQQFKKNIQRLNQENNDLKNQVIACNEKLQFENNKNYQLGKKMSEERSQAQRKLLQTEQYYLNQLKKQENQVSYQSKARKSQFSQEIGIQRQLQRQNRLRNQFQTQRKVLKENLQRLKQNQNKLINKFQVQNKILKDNLKEQKEKLENQKMKLAEQKLKCSKQQYQIRYLQEQIKKILMEVQVKENKMKMQRENSKKTTQPANKLDMLFNNAILPLEYVMKSFIVDAVQNQVGRKIKNTLLLYKYDKLNKQTFHTYIYGYPNLFLIIKTQEGRYIAAFTQDMVKLNHIIKKKGLLMSLNPEQGRSKYFAQLPTNKNYKSVSHNNYQIQFGNAELRLKSNSDKIESKVGSNFATRRYFDTKQETAQTLFGISPISQGALIQTYEFWRIDFEE